MTFSVVESTAFELSGDGAYPAAQKRRKKWTAPSPRSTPNREEWVVRSRAEFFGADRNPIKHSHLRLLLIHESMSGSDCFHFRKSQEVAALYGCHRCQLQVLHKQMEALGLIHRVYRHAKGEAQLVGTIICRRSDPTLAVADTDAKLEQAIADLTARRNSRQSAYLPFPDGGEAPPAERESIPNHVDSLPPTIVRRGARQRAPGARASAPQGRAPARPNIQGLIDKEQTTTTEAEDVVVVVEASPIPEESGPVEQPLKQLDPCVSATILREFSEVERIRVEEEFAARLPDWISKFRLDWIARAILNTLAARHSRAIPSLAGHAEGTLKNWKRDGEPTIRIPLAPPKPPRSTEEIEAERQAIAEAEAARLRAKLDVEREEARAKAEAEAAYQSLDTEQLALYSAGFDALHPHVPGSHPGMRAAHRKRWIIDAMQLVEQQSIAVESEKSSAECPEKYLGRAGHHAYLSPQNYTVT